MPQSFGEHFGKVTLSDLTQATRDFSESNLIGGGSYGSVYRGKLKESKMEVAVKVFDLEMRGAERSFVAECEALRSIQHRNLLPIITACSTVDNIGNDFKALIYELMPNGSLDTWLHHKGDEEAPKRLSLTQRISIAVNIADALDYLHHDCGRPTVHCDLKPSNILLEDDMNALLGDFGIACFFADPQSTWAGSIRSIGMKGTIGYIPPGSYFGIFLLGTSNHIFLFNLVLLEILIGKRPTDAMFMDRLDIISFVENSFQSQIFDVIDVHLVEECKNLTQDKNVPEKEINKCLLDLVQVAFSCTRSLPSERSNMKQIASEMHAIKVSQLGWMTCKK
ncbi:receptor kinase-like protein Xa21 [Miscanthus floridulus]|uniref:receptor kinase-like protein Xa21 n=1 Tax=Miscanthus floridulus TaxID=154761 RepID=UPI0034598DB2